MSGVTRAITARSIGRAIDGGKSAPRRATKMSVSRSAGISRMYMPFIHVSFSTLKIAGFLTTRSSVKCSMNSSREMISVLSSSDQPISPRKLKTASGRNPWSRYSKTLVAPWRLLSFEPSAPTMSGRCAITGTS